jgi:hypothetical protein
MSVIDAAPILSEVVARWRDRGIARRGATREAFDQVEQRCGARLPCDLKALLCLADGMDDGNMDDLMIRFWPIEEMRSAVEEAPDGDPRPYEGFFTFADYSLWSHGYSIKMGDSGGSVNEGVVAVVGGPLPVVVASSFAEFVENYLRCPERLFVKKR